MNFEFDILNDNNSWKFTERRENKKAIDLKWIFKKENDVTYKARIVSRVIQQREEIDNTYSPVFTAQTLNILL